ncbi:uncharacterized protein LOC112093645 [Morus notabilis]|uniref:uncharacterized protein LOC112093645 n=1 Tax=Morus notabilis TaxID=981085 RepID=UPI000CED68BC|nr:uncharacterized protein LOC112093645 [Morus notabilis]
MTKNDATIQTLVQLTQNLVASQRNMEVQIGQLANEVNSHPQGNFPSSTETNPKEQCKAITLRSGKELKEPARKREEETYGKKEADVEISEVLEKETEQGAKKPATKLFMNNPPLYTPLLPFPWRFLKQKLDKQFSKFLDVFKKLQINIPFTDALEQMPSYANFMKESLTKKRRLADFEIVKLTEECSAILQKKLPQKAKDSGSFTIPCTIANAYFDQALSIKGPQGIIEDVLVKVDKFIFPVDFIVLDMDEDEEIPIIVRRPFLATGRTLIDVQKRELVLRFKDEKVVFNVFKAINYPSETDYCMRLDTIEQAIQEAEDISSLSDLIEECINMETRDDFISTMSASEKEPITEKVLIASIHPAPTSQLPSVDQPPQLELKPLSSHLRYAFLGESY